MLRKFIKCVINNKCKLNIELVSVCYLKYKIISESYYSLMSKVNDRYSRIVYLLFSSYELFFIFEIKVLQYL